MSEKQIKEAIVNEIKAKAHEAEMEARFISIMHVRDLRYDNNDNRTCICLYNLKSPVAQS